MLRHSTLLYLLFLCCYSMTTFSTLFRHDDFLNAAVHRLLFPLCCTMTIFPRCCVMYSLTTLLRYGYFFCAAVPYLLLAPYCAMSTFSTLLRHIFSFHAAVLCLIFPRCCALSTFSTRLLRLTPFSMIDRTTC